MRVYKRVGNTGVSMRWWYFIFIYPFVMIFKAMWYMMKTALLVGAEIYKQLWRGCVWCFRKLKNLFYKK